MQDPKPSKLARTKNFVARHKTALTVIPTIVATAAVVSTWQKSALKEAYDFIDAANLTDKFLESVPAEEIYT